MLQQKRKGFTLIELLIVVVIIGILAAIAIPKFASTKEKAYVSAMKSDLRNFATAQEAYFSTNMNYASDAATANFVATNGVTVTVTGASASGYTATASHASLQASETCTIKVGSAAGATEREGTPVCWNETPPATS